MKSAKEWAASVVAGPYHDGDRWVTRLEDDGDYVPLEPQPRSDCGNSIATAAAGIIERLVERVQADARAPLEEEIARLKEDRDIADGLIGAWIGLVAATREKLKRSLEPGADTVGYVRELVQQLTEQTRL